MSARRLPRQMGTWVCCDGTADKGCPTNERRFTGNIVFQYNREHLATEGWGRGLRLGYKRRDLCPSCLKIERVLFEEAKAKTEAWKKERAERRKAAWAEKQEAKKAELAANPKPKKPRSKKQSAQPSESPPPSLYCEPCRSEFGL